MGKLRKKFDATFTAMWPKWDIAQTACLKIDLEANRLHHHFKDREELKSAKESLSSPPIIQTASRKPYPTFFPGSEMNVSNDGKQISDLAKVAKDAAAT